MSILGLFRARSIRVAWEYHSTGVFWRVLPHGEKFLIGEERDVASKRVAFFCIDFERGVPHWRGVSLSEAWWVGLEAVHGDSVILHGYASPDMPEHRKIYVLDLRTGSLLWQNDDLAFVAVEGDALFAKKDLFDDRSVVELDLRSGSVRREQVDRPGAVTPPQTPGAAFPHAISSAGGLPDAARSLFRAVGVEENVPSGIEYLEEGAYSIVSWYEPVGDELPPAAWCQRLGVVRREDGSVQYSDMISATTSFPVPDSFFTMAHRLCYVRERSHLRTLILKP